MREDFIHYLWKYKKFEAGALKTTKGHAIEILASGLHNQNAGPDFFNAQVRIANQLWAGNVEIHIKSSDWFVHNHEIDPSYDNVILHVVWEHDTEVFRKDNTELETLELKPIVSSEALINYQKLFGKSRKWIHCELDFNNVDDFLITHWLERLFIERLERKSEELNRMLLASKNDWEAVLFKMLAKNFGLKVNGEAFLSIANSIDFSVIRKEQSQITHLEAILFGQAGFFEEQQEDAYYKELCDLYTYKKHKYQLKNHAVVPMQFFRLRPSNFPTIRLAQLAGLYHYKKQLFAALMSAKTKDDIYAILNVSTSEYWNDHYTFGSLSKKMKKKTTRAFVDLLLINTIIPLKFCYAKHLGRNVNEEIIQWMSQLKIEQNSIIKAFNLLNPIFKTAMHSQGLIQLKSNYCEKHKCLQCAIGNAILSN